MTDIDRTVLIEKYKKIIVATKNRQKRFLGSGNNAGVYLVLQGEINAYLNIIEDLEPQLKLKL